MNELNRSTNIDLKWGQYDPAWRNGGALRKNQKSYRWKWYDDKAKDYLGYHPISAGGHGEIKWPGWWVTPPPIWSTMPPSSIPQHGVYAVKMKWKSFKRGADVYWTPIQYACRSTHIEVNLFWFPIGVWWASLESKSVSNLSGQYARQLNPKEMLLAQIGMTRKILAYFKSLLNRCVPPKHGIGSISKL